MIRLSKLVKVAAGLAVVGTLALVAGFFAFCALLPRAGDDRLAELTAEGAMDRGIIVLTGENGSRIERALAIQAQGVADRVLISGVHPRTTKADLAAMGPADVLECCVDLGPWARSTGGNAVEGRDWLRRNGYGTAILVTSDFHLPRASTELRYAAPEIAIIGVPVASGLAPETGWMSEPRAWRLLAKEYAKYLFVRLRSLV